ncbi:MAG: hypothetical protein HC836_26195 [Richelia sp. RM2_1_2]|nr:hypothetical protein [Richelia sp. RM2_1_2]
MSQNKRTGGVKPVYYTPNMLTDEEQSRFYQFLPSLSEHELLIVTAWCKKLKNYAIIDEDYIFFTQKVEHDEFKKYWANYKIALIDRQEIEFKFELDSPVIVS